MPDVSVIIPAYNAAATIREAIESLCMQTNPHWEAVIVDDGSSDGTAEIVAALMTHEPRIRLIRQANAGVGAARNLGAAVTSAPWLHFLDADDWIAPEYFAHLLAAEPDLDIIHCGWQRVTPQGKIGPAAFGPAAAGLFEVFAQYCALPTTGLCLVRRTCFEQVGGFDPSFRSCGDWDLWLRLSRMGARFGGVPEPLVFYRMSPTSITLASNSSQILANALRVVTMAHSADPRVHRPCPEYAQGMPAEQLAERRLLVASWCAGMVIGHGSPATLLLTKVTDDRAPNIDTQAVAEVLFDSVPRTKCAHSSAWPAIWDAVEPHLTQYLVALESHSGAEGLQARALTALKRLVAAQVDDRAVLLGDTIVIPVELTAKCAAVHLPEGVAKLCFSFNLAGQHLGLVDRPVGKDKAELTPAEMVTVAIEQYKWEILGHFFAQTLYPMLTVRTTASGVELWRDKLCLDTNLAPEVATNPALAHNQVGWTLLLQELWGQPTWSRERFYTPRAYSLAWPLKLVGDRLELDLSAQLPTVMTFSTRLSVHLHMGREMLGPVVIMAPKRLITPEQLIASITEQLGLELCRAAVAEGIIGQPLGAAPISLRARLARHS